MLGASLLSDFVTDSACFRDEKIFILAPFTRVSLIQGRISDTHISDEPGQTQESVAFRAKILNFTHGER